jgi:O-antigen/teichoic acid export membrane protein
VTDPRSSPALRSGRLGAVHDARRSLAERTRAHLADPLSRSAYSLTVNVGVTSLLGVAFWAVAARICSSSTVGRDSALISAMLTLASIAELNLGRALYQLLPVTPHRRGWLVARVYGIASAFALLLGCAFVIVVPALAHGYSFLRSDQGLRAAFVVGVCFWVVFAIQDAVLTAVRQTHWVPVENAVFGGLKLLALPAAVAVAAQHGIFLAWTLPMLGLLVPVNLFIFRRALRVSAADSSRTSIISGFTRRRLIRFLAQDYAASATAQAAVTLLPILIVGLLGARANAYFYMPFMIVTAFDLLFLNMANALMVEASFDESRLPELLRSVLRRCVALLVPGVVILIVGAPLILAPFGASYVEHGTSVLRILALGSIFRALIPLFEAVSRVEGNSGRTMVAQAAVFVLLGSFVVAGHSSGLPGVAVAWVAAYAIVAASVAPTIARVLKRPPAVQLGTRH